MVQSPTWHNELRIQCCHSCGIGCNYGSDLIPGPGTPYATGCPKRKRKKDSLSDIQIYLDSYILSDISTDVKPKYCSLKKTSKQNKTKKLSILSLWSPFNFLLVFVLFCFLHVWPVEVPWTGIKPLPQQ